MRTEIQNAIIESTTISNDDRGFLTIYIFLRFDGGGQGFGGYMLYAPEHAQNVGNYAGHFIWRVLEIAGVTEWERLKGKTVRVKSLPFGPIEGIGHIIEDKWFYPKEEFEAIKTGVNPKKDK